jgi:hypothetical protein
VGRLLPVGKSPLYPERMGAGFLLFCNCSTEKNWYAESTDFTEHHWKERDNKTIRAIRSFP